MQVRGVDVYVIFAWVDELYSGMYKICEVFVPANGSYLFLCTKKETQGTYPTRCCSTLYVCTCLSIQRAWYVVVCSIHPVLCHPIQSNRIRILYPSTSFHIHPSPPIPKKPQEKRNTTINLPSRSQPAGIYVSIRHHSSLSICPLPHRPTHRPTTEKQAESHSPHSPTAASPLYAPSPSPSPSPSPCPHCPTPPPPSPSPH